MTEGERTIGAELAELIPRLSEYKLRLLLAYGSGLADAGRKPAAVRDSGAGT